MQLDRSRPFAEVIGRPGVAFEQDGRNFRQDGSEVVPQATNSEAPHPGADSLPAGRANAERMPQPQPIAQEKRGPGRPRKVLSGSTALASQFAGYEAPIEWDSPVAAPSGRDVLADYRGSGASGPAIWVDGV